MSEARIWERLKYQLDRGVDVSQITASATETELGILEEEIGGYLQGKHAGQHRQTIQAFTDGAKGWIEIRRNQIAKEGQ